MPCLAKDDYYEILNVLPNATEDEIRNAYMALAIANHPDKQVQQDPTAVPDTRPFIRIMEAWNTLRDPELRRIYDAELFQGQLDDVPMVHQVLDESDITQDPNGTGFSYICRCGARCQVDRHTCMDDSWRYNTCDECSHVVEMNFD